MNKKVFFYIFSFFLFNGELLKASPHSQLTRNNSQNLGYARAIWNSNLSLKVELSPQAASEQKLFFFLTQREPQNLFLKSPISTQGDLKLSLLKWTNTHVLLNGQNLKDQLSTLIRGPLTLLVVNEQSQLIDKTSLQLAPLLDAYYAYTGSLGLLWKGTQPEFNLWAPTAQKVTVKIYDHPLTKNHLDHLPLVYEHGVWKGLGHSTWKNKFYLYEIVIFHPLSQKMETFEVTDPYSTGLSMNSTFSQILNPKDPELKPQGWDQMKKTHLASMTDAVLYEVHLRDWTAGDPTIPTPLRGTFKGLTTTGAQSFEYLKKLAQSGITHLHLMPIADFATVNEDKTTWKFLNIQPNTPAYSPFPQGELDKIKDQDAYNWGYDPVHWLTPEGSYSTQSDGRTRIYELREMIQNLNQIGLRIVLDVVFNHTYENGITPFSVLDKIVPLYYYRLDSNGVTYNSSCCADTASEHFMMEKLMIDALKYWATEFKIDGFRFDLMNLHTIENIRNIKNHLQQMKKSTDGVDGSQLLLYGEAWEFGSLEHKLPGTAFFQTRSAGTGIAVFNDRLRDALRGGTTNSKEKSDPGFISGLFYDFNHDPANRNTPIDPWDQKEKLQHLTDVIKIGLAGNLKQYEFFDYRKNWITAGTHFFRGSPTALAKNPEETINYISAHDGYSLWDSLQAKLPFAISSRFPNTATEEDRVRSLRMGLSIVALSQGIPFFENGGELLRSRSGDQDGYNSGDWFNQIDFSFKSNNWGVGLPPHWKNSEDWNFWSPRLSTPELHPSSEAIYETARYFFALLKVRKSSPLFRLPNSDLIQRSLTFPRDDQTQSFAPGVIAMQLDNVNPSKTKDKVYQKFVIFFNATNSRQRYQILNLKNKNLSLHPDFTEAIDSRLRSAQFENTTGVFNLPERTTVIYKEEL